MASVKPGLGCALPSQGLEPTRLPRRALGPEMKVQLLLCELLRRTLCRWKFIVHILTEGSGAGV